MCAAHKGVCLWHDCIRCFLTTVNKHAGRETQAFITGQTRNRETNLENDDGEILMDQGFAALHRQPVFICSLLPFSPKYRTARRKIYTETYRSGHNGADSKSVSLFWARGFESHRLRHTWLNDECCLAIFLFWVRISAFCEAQTAQHGVRGV